MDQEKKPVYSFSPQQLKKHPSLLLHKEVSQICRSFFNQFDMNIINFIRIYKDQSVSYLCDNYAWLEHYLLNNYPSIGAFEQSQFTLQNDYVLWDSLSEKDPIIIDSRKIFNIYHGVTFVRKYAEWIDFFNFGTAYKERHEFQKILSQIEQLQHFINHFYDKTKKLMLKVEQHQFKLDQFVQKKELSLQPSRLYLGQKYGYTYLTQKEVECLKYLSNGNSILEISLILQSSTRTIEKHIENIKHKLSCKNQFELGYISSKIGIKFT